MRSGKGAICGVILVVMITAAILNIGVLEAKRDNNKAAAARLLRAKGILKRRRHYEEEDQAINGYGGGLKNNFYETTNCPGAEELIRKVTWNKVKSDATLPARLLRVQFHDCFVTGCDGSILLNSTGDNVVAEKDSPASRTLAGFQDIDDIKAQVELQCPGVVSCADVLALATRDAVSYEYNRVLWDVPTGRRDATVSLASEIAGNIPSPFSNFDALLKLFQTKGLDLNDLVLLSGAHTIGVAHCGAFSRRLYNFTGNGDTDPSLDADYAASLKKQCPNPATPAAFVVMDPTTPASLDNTYYKILTEKKGLLQSDAALLTNSDSAKMVSRLQQCNNAAFLAQFGQSMKKMGAIGVLTGNAGQIRKLCTRAN